MNQTVIQMKKFIKCLIECEKCYIVLTVCVSDEQCVNESELLLNVSCVFLSGPDYKKEGGLSCNDLSSVS